MWQFPIFVFSIEGLEVARKRIDCGPPIELSNGVVFGKIMQRCTICEECGEKTHFLGAQNGSGVYPVKINGKFHSVRRLVFEFNGGKLKSNGKIITKCHNHRCINPAKLKQVTMSEIIKQAVADGNFMGELHKYKIAQSKRKANGKINQTDADAIRYDGRSSTVIAAEMGLSSSFIRSVKNGRVRKNYFENVFSGLGAR